MSNNWHTPTPDLVAGDIARAEDINDKITAIDVAFDKLPEPHATDKGFAEAIMVGEPTEDGHAANRSFVETGMTSQVVAAAASATAAAASASSASTSASSASTSASTASTAATNAAASATSASNSATSASTSATTASTAATNASTSATAAATSATNASNSATSASSSASTATTQASAASASASAAATSATNASNSASSASTSAATATTQATNAATSATSASTSATNAATSATNAANSATAADASADLAALWAEEDEDVEVTTGQYSAKHWAAKAALSASAFSIVTGNSGTATADSNGDTIAITGTNGITTTATPGASAALSIAPSYGSSISQVQAGVAASAGVATTIARSDHVHNISTGAASTLSASTSNAEGSASSLARSDHLHTISTGSPSTNLTASTSNSAGTAATLARSDHSHAITTAAATTLTASTTNGAGTAASLARSDHTHAITTGTPVALGASASAGSAAGLARSDHVHPYPTSANVGAVADPGSNGLMSRSAANVSVARTITGPAAGLTVTNGNGVSGNPTLALANDLAALEGLASTGIAVRSATDTWVQRTITGTSGEISVSNGNGVSGNPTLSLGSSVARQQFASEFSSQTATVPLSTIYESAILPPFIELDIYAVCASDFYIGLRANLVDTGHAYVNVDGQSGGTNGNDSDTSANAVLLMHNTANGVDAGTLYHAHLEICTGSSLYNASVVGTARYVDAAGVHHNVQISGRLNLGGVQLQTLQVYTATTVSSGDIGATSPTTPVISVVLESVNVL